MKPNLKAILLILGILTTTRSSPAQGTALTYNGRLNDNGAAANANYDMTFNLYDAENGGNLVAGPVSLTPVPVVNGLFAVKIDFGAAAFTGADRWLGVSVRRTGTPDFTTLVPRQGLTSSPYAIYATTAANVSVNSIGPAAIQNGSISAAKIAPGQVVTSLNGLSDAVTLQAVPPAMLTPNGNNLVLSVSGGGSGPWGQNGANAFYTAGNVGIGTTTPQEELTIAGIANYNTGLKLTGSAATGIGFALENTFAGGHKYALFAGGSGNALGAGGFGIYDDTASAYRLAISSNGNVGINSYAPAAKFEVASSGGEVVHLIGAGPSLSFYDSNTGYARHALQSLGGGLSFLTDSYLTGNGPFNYMVINNNGNVGIGSSAPVAKLDVASTGGEVVHLIGAGPSLSFYDSNTGYTRHALQSLGGGLNFLTDSYLTGNGPFNYMVINNNGNVGIGTATPQMKLDVNGTTRTKALTITGGADLAEPFAISHQGISPGAVVIIDEENPGHLKLSTQAYDERVAGVVSGANGIRPGISLHQEGALEGGENVALSGRVYVQADATFGAIQPGDLLTTSNTPGHAMKVLDHTKAQGAVLGKAMSSLKEGKGLVLVLVTLQ